MSKKQIKISGFLLHKKTKEPIEGLKVEAWDKDIAFDDLLGNDITNSRGQFTISFTGKYFREFILDRKPDLYFKIYKDNQLIHNTRKEVIYNIEGDKDDIVILVDTDHTVTEEEKLTFFGIVKHDNGNVIPNITVVINEKRLKDATRLNKTVTDANGFYSMEVEAKKGNIVYEINVPDEKGQSIATSGNIYDAGRKNEVNLAVIDITYKGDTAFKQLSRILADYQNIPADKPLTIDDIRLVGYQKQVDIQEVWYWFRSNELSKETQIPKEEIQIPAEAFYGWFKQELPTNIDNLATIDTDTLIEALKSSAANNYISVEIVKLNDEIIRHWNLYLAQQALLAKPKMGSSLKDILSVAVQDDKLQKKIMLAYLNHKGSTEDFWSNLHTVTGDETTTSKIQQSLQLSVITGSQQEMLQSLFDEHVQPGVKNAISQLAVKDEDDWKDYIKRISEQTGKSVVPDFIEGKNEDERITEYARTMASTLETVFPTPAFMSRLAKDPNEGPFASSKNDLLQFFKSNPDFDLASSSTISLFGPELKYEFKDIANKEQLLKELQGIQRISAYTSRYAEVSAMKKAGFDSAASIVQVPREQFFQSANPIFGSLEKTQEVYTQAENNYMAAAGLWANWHPSLHSTAVTPSGPTLRALFGSQDACECEHCTSVFSPAAYYADLLHFLYKRTDVYTELVRRRPDLPFIKLNCENANTPLPYVDLVIELLENFVLTHKPGPKAVPDSYQTTWQAAELAANPEHLDYDAYDELKKAVYPQILPFHFPLEETRIYLNHLGEQRHQLMAAFFPGTPEEAFDDFMIGMERLNISLQEAKILTGETSGDGTATSGTHNFYGFDKETGFKALTDPADSSQAINSGTWVEVLSSRVDVFLQQTAISYKELLTLLLCNFINPGAKKITIVAKTTDAAGKDVQPDTCQLDLLELKGLDENDLKKIHRFLRLWRKLGWTMFQLDKAMTAFSAADLDKTNLKKIGQAEFIKNTLSLSVEEVLALWSDIDAANHYVDFFSDHYPQVQSLYKSLFKNKSVLKTQNDFTAFPDDPATIPAGTTINGDIETSILAALKITETDYGYLIDPSNAAATKDFTIKNLSALYRHTLLAKKLNYTIKDFLAVKSLIGIADPFKDPLTSFGFLQKVDTIKYSGFSVNLVRYLLKHEFELDTLVAPPNDAISVFLTELRAALRAIRTDTEDKQKNTLAQKFSEKLKITSNASSLLLQHISNSLTANRIEKDFLAADFETSAFLKTYTVPDPLDITKRIEVEPAFVHVNDGVPGHVALPELFDDFRKLDKIATFINKLKLPDAELEVILNHAAPIGCTDLKTLPVSVMAGNFNAFEILVRLIQARDVLPIGLPAYADILNIAIQSTTATLPADKQAWIEGLTKRTRWDKRIVEALIGDHFLNNKAGILKKTFPDDFRNGDSILQLKNCMSMLNKLGLQPDVIDLAIKEDPDDVEHTVAKAIKNAAKAKYNESQWLKIAKPLRDVLRERQRASLVAYVIAHANFDPATNKFERWKDSNELYDYLLIDVEMKPISMTSRIKQAICSVQLYIDKVLMNLIYANTNPLPPVPGAPPPMPLQMAAEQVKEWKTWRKLYRVWEANRKIFLYPENWIEESLRDNKSPFFKSLETTLQQNELNVDNVEDAFHAYLESLDEVARLEVVGLYHQVEAADDTRGEVAIDTLHVIARTYAHPSKYFYRTLENCSTDQKEWTAWKKIEIEIDGHPIPVIFNRKLCLFWLFYTQQAEQSKSFDAQRGPTPQPPVYWKIQVAWSEYKKGKWSTKRLSKAHIESEHFSSSLNDLYYSSVIDDSGITQGGKNQFVDTVNFIAFTHLVEFRERLIIWDTIQSDGTLVIELKSANFQFAGQGNSQKNAAFLFNDTNTDPIIDFSHQFPSSDRTAQNIVHTDQMQKAWRDDQAFVLRRASNSEETQILDQSKQHAVRLVLPADELEPYDKHFFFQDAKNTFYVEHSLVPFQKVLINPDIVNLRNIPAATEAIWKGYREVPPPPNPLDPEVYFLNLKNSPVREVVLPNRANHFNNSRQRNFVNTFNQ